MAQWHRNRGGYTSARSASTTSCDTATKPGLKGQAEFGLAFSLFRLVSAFSFWGPQSANQPVKRPAASSV
jgi:hypothetical protein